MRPRQTDLAGNQLIIISGGCEGYVETIKIPRHMYEKVDKKAEEKAI